MNLRSGFPELPVSMPAVKYDGGYKMELQKQYHEFPPVYDETSEILILGSFPSVKSREVQFFYGHPQNRFWKLLARLLKSSVPESIEEKKHLLLTHHIALWDVIASCEISGSSDSSIRNVVPNDISYIIERSCIKKVFANGGKAKQLYDRYLTQKTGLAAELLPSTSPANASYSLDRLAKHWEIILSFLSNTERDSSLRS